MKKSPFAKGVKSLIDDTAIFSRQDWASMLGVSCAAISQWVNDRTVPRPEYLKFILDTVNDEVDDRVRRVLFDFKEMLGRPIVDVSPLSFKIPSHANDIDPNEYTVGQYIDRSSLVRDVRSRKSSVPAVPMGNRSFLAFSDDYEALLPEKKK